MGALVLYANYTSIRLIFLKGQKKRKQKRKRTGRGDSKDRIFTLKTIQALSCSLE